MSSPVTGHERALAGLYVVLSTVSAGGVPPLLQRQSGWPDVLPEVGLLTLLDGEPGEPEITLSPLTYTYTRRALVELAVAGPDEDQRIARVEALLLSLGKALDADPTLGGAVEWCTPEAPSVRDDVIGGSVRVASVPVLLTYDTSGPLS
jgi:hypothetical protein